MHGSSGFSQRQQLMTLCAILSAALLAMVSITVFYGLPLKARAETPEASVEPQEAIFAYAPVALSHTEDSPKIGGKGSGLVNILLIGQDRREDEPCSRADTILLCSFHKKSGRIIMTSFLRDLYVPIPGHDKNRLNAAYAFGGASLLKQTIEENFDILLDGCVEVDFSQFAQIVDILGGVTLNLRQDEANAINKATGGTLCQGQQWLCGQQALAYTRIRKLDDDGDFSRTLRQRNVIHALISSYRESDPLEAISTLTRLLPLLSTDMDNSRIISVVLQLLPMLPGSTVVSQRIPADGMYTYSTIREMSVITADMAQNRGFLHDSLTTSP